MRRKIIVLSGLFALVAGGVTAARWGFEPVRFGAFRAFQRVSAGQEVVFRERLPRGTYLISLYGTRGELWRARDDSDYWGLFRQGGPLGRSGPNVRGVEREPAQVEIRRGGAPEGELLTPEPLNLEVERRYSQDGKLDAIRPTDRDVQRLEREIGGPAIKGAPPSRQLEIERYRDRDFGWYRDLPGRFRGGPDVDIYVFNRNGRLVARSDSYESSEALLLDVDPWSGQTLEFVVHAARGTGNFYLTVTRF
jgi:hypothetical protein